MKILLGGCGGAMGRTLTRVIMDKDDISISAGVDKFPPETSLFTTYRTYCACKEKVDVIVDFTHPSALNDLLDFAVSNSLPVGLSTTGHDAKQKKMIKKASLKIPIFMSVYFINDRCTWNYTILSSRIR